MKTTPQTILVLIVDDDRLIRDTLPEWFGAYHHWHVHPASDSGEALEELGRQRFDSMLPVTKAKVAALKFSPKL